MIPVPATKTPNKSNTPAGGASGSDLSPAGLFGGLPLVRVRFGLMVSGSGLPAFLGSAARGLLGWELQRLVCPFSSRPACKACVIKEHCPYFVLIEGETDLPGLADSPRGYVLLLERNTEENDRYWFSVTLFGGCSRFLAAVTAAVLSGRERGLGSRRFPFQVETLEEVLPGGASRPLPLRPESLRTMPAPASLTAWMGNSASLAASGRVRLRFSTPLRLRRQGKYLGALDGPFFLDTLARRLEAMNILYNDGAPLSPETRAGLHDLFSGFTPLALDLTWRDQGRYSGTQRCKVPMGGLVGWVEAEVSPVVGEWLCVAALLHVGKGAAMGMGKVEVSLLE